MIGFLRPDGEWEWRSEAEPDCFSGWKSRLFWSRITISGPVIAASRHQQGAFVQALEEEMRRVREERAEMQRRYRWGLS